MLRYQIFKKIALQGEKGEPAQIDFTNYEKGQKGKFSF